MKLKLLRWLLPAIVPAALMFGAASPALAVSYNCDGPINPVPSNPSGSVEIEVTSGDCVIDHDVTAQGQIQITVKNGGSLDAQNLKSVTGAIFLISDAGNIKAKNVIAGTVIQIKAGLTGGSETSTIDVENVISNTTDVATNANIMLQSWGPIKTKNIQANGENGTTQRSGGVQIDANMSGANNLLTIGGSGGIDGVIDTRSVVGGGTQLQRVESGIRITNGTANSTGGITLTAMNKLLVKNTGSRSGQIELNARKGTITLPSGVLDVSEQNGSGAGFIFLLANKVAAPSGATLRANQATTTTGYNHQVVIAAETIQFASGLTITADGNGASASLPATVYVVPQGGVTSISNDNLNSLLWTRTFTGTFFSFPGSVTFDGGGSAPLTLSANGNFSQIIVTGYPIRFDTGNLTVRSRGNGVKNEIVMGFGDDSDFDHTKGISFLSSSTSTLTFTTNGVNPGDKGGYIQIQSDLIAVKGMQHTFTADGATTGASDGGQVIFVGHFFDRSPSGTVLISADASLNGSGNARTDEPFGAVYFWFSGTQAAAFGTENNQIKVTANGGKTGGSAGLITIGSSNIEVRTTEAFTAFARGGNGNGGDLRLFGTLQMSPENGITRKDVFKLAGRGTGEGGKFKAFYQPDSIFDFLKAISINGGTNLSVGGKDGRINFNAVTCQQFRYGTAYPKGYWNCINPDSPQARDEIPVSVLASYRGPVRSRLRDNNTAIFTFANSLDFMDFTLQAIPTEAGGFTYGFRDLNVDPVDGSIYVSVFQTGTLGAKNGSTVSYDDNQYTEASAHEIAHGIDAATTRQSQRVPYLDYAERDLANLDYVVIGSDQASSTERLPCKRTPMPGGGFYPGKAPFVDVIDLTSGLAVCNSDGTVHSNWAGLRNFQILKDLEIIWDPTALGGPWVEGYAQTSAFRKVGALGVRPMMDKVYQNGHFACAKAFANAVHNGDFSGPATAPDLCGTEVPQWYRSLLGLPPQ